MKKPIRPAYEQLGVSLEATKREIRKKYKELAREFTPEHYPEKFEEISTIYQKITGKIPENFQEFPIYASPIEFLKKSIAIEKEATFDADKLSPLKNIPESIFTVEFQLEKIIG